MALIYALRGATVTSNLSTDFARQNSSQYRKSKLSGALKMLSNMLDLTSSTNVTRHSPRKRTIAMLL
jgi:hypothetical protein